MPKSRSKVYKTAADRWAAVGPYYAMFPLHFADRVVARYTRPGDGVIDPFAGRGTSLFSAATRGRPAVGVEINPVGWVYGKTKLCPASRDRLDLRLKEVDAGAPAPDVPHDAAEFFYRCFSPEILSFLIEARSTLDWRRSDTDRTLMAFILVYLHGKYGYALSNQMRQSKAMSPDYSVAWWKARGLKPPDISPREFLSSRIWWRYERGVPEVSENALFLADSTRSMGRLGQLVRGGRFRRFKLLFTSPPYQGVTNYFYDQWLRHWMLGGSWRPAKIMEPSKGKFESLPKYQKLLTTVFEGCSELMSRSGTVYVRADAREATLNTTVDVLRAAFPKWRLRTYARPLASPTQTALFGDTSPKPGDVDIILHGPHA